MPLSLLLRMNGHEQLYYQYSQSLLELAEKIVHDPEVARDIVHDAWIVIITGIDKIDNPEKEVSWMKGIVRNLSLKHLRYQSRHKMQPINQEAKLKIDDFSEDPLIPYEELMTLIKTLPERYGSVFRLAVLQNKTHEEIGKLLGIAPHSSSSNLARAKKILRERIGKYLLLLFCLLLTLVQVKDSVTVTFEPGESIDKDNSIAAVSEPLAQQIDEVLYVSKFTSTSKIAEASNLRESECMLPQLDRIQPVVAIANAAGHYTIKPALSRYNPGTSRLQRRSIFRSSDIKDGWRVFLGGIPITATQSVLERAFTIVPDFTGGTKAIDNWADYQSFLFNNKGYLLPEQYENLHRFAFENSLRYFDIIEKQTDFKPVSLDISFEKELIGRWSLRSGFGVTFMKSLTEAGDPTVSYMSGTRKTWYLGVPLGVNYQMFQNSRLSFYSTAGGRLDIPIAATHSMEFAFDNTKEESITLYGVRQVAPGIIWSINVGTGLQYQIVPHLRLYLEPTLQYHFPNSTGLQTWYSTHPLSFEVPLGIRINW